LLQLNPTASKAPVRPKPPAPRADLSGKPQVRPGATCAPPVGLDAIGGDGLGADRVDHIHQGYDLMDGLTDPIYAVKAGVIVKAQIDGSRDGTIVKLRHDDNGQISWYLHVVPYSWALAPVGTHVKMGQPIALVGREGDSSGPHLHFEIHRGPGRGTHTVMNPVAWLQDCGVTYKREPHEGK
jgi:murein DD-endopeptidase MepM/ murein hydrolase activator NlpD